MIATCTSNFGLPPRVSFGWRLGGHRFHRFHLMLPLPPDTRAWCVASWDNTVPSLLHDERDVVNDIQPLGVVIWKVVKVRSNPIGFGLGLARLPLLL